MNLSAFKANVKHDWRILIFSGPVGLAHAVRLAWIDRRLKRVALYIEREKELHRRNLASLRYKQNQLISAQQGTQIAAAQYWRYCEKQAGVQS